MPCIDEIHGKPARFENLVERYPVNARRFHCHRIHAAAHQPVRQFLQVFGETFKLPDRFIVTIRRHRHKMACRTDVDSRRIRVRQFQCRSLALCHVFLHHLVWNAATVRVRRYTHSLKRDDCFRGLTNVADVTRDHAHLRAGTLQ